MQSTPLSSSTSACCEHFPITQNSVAQFSVGRQIWTHAGAQEALVNQKGFRVVRAHRAFAGVGMANHVAIRAICNHFYRWIYSIHTDYVDYHGNNLDGYGNSGHWSGANLLF